MRLCIDLCSGRGGFSQAFVQAGWEVVTVDIESKFNPTICADVTALSAEKIEEATAKKSFAAYDRIIVLASPPCERFSLACRTWPKKGVQKAMETVGACLELIAEIKPNYWVLENPKARLRWFLGTPKGTIRLSDYGTPYLKPTDYWGNVPLPFLKATVPPRMYLRPMKHDLKTPSPIYLSGADKAGRSKLPAGFSRAILKAVSVEAA